MILKRGWVGTIVKSSLKSLLPLVSQGDTSSPMSSTPLLLLQVSNDPLQFSTFFPFYRLQDLSWTLGLAHWGLPAKRLAVLLDEDMLVLPRGDTNRANTHTGSRVGAEVSGLKGSRNKDDKDVGGAKFALKLHAPRNSLLNSRKFYLTGMCTTHTNISCFSPV